MKTALKPFLAAAITAGALVLVPAFAVAKDNKKTTADTVVTVYISAHGGSAMAKKANESHMAMEAQGWRFANMEVHSENGDTEGAWITYVK